MTVLAAKAWDEMAQQCRFAGATTEEEKWVLLYKMIFPNENVIPSPCESTARAV